MTGETWEVYNSDALSPALGGIFVRSGQVRRITDDGSTPVAGPLGTEQFDLVDPSQSWDGGTITALDSTDAPCWSPTPSSPLAYRSGSRGANCYRRPSTRLVGSGPSTLVGHAAVRVLAGEGSWEPASVRGYPGRLTAFRVSVDGTRVAVVVREGQ